MRTVTLSVAAVVLAGFLASDAVAQRRGAGDDHGARVSSVAHHGRVSHHGRYDAYRRPPYVHHRHHGNYGRDRYRGHHGYRGYRAPVIVAPRGCGYPPAHGVYRPNYHPLNTFYYGGRNFGIGISF